MKNIILTICCIAFGLVTAMISILYLPLIIICLLPDDKFEKVTHYLQYPYIYAVCWLLAYLCIRYGLQNYFEPTFWTCCILGFVIWGIKVILIKGFIAAAEHLSDGCFLS